MTGQDRLGLAPGLTTEKERLARIALSRIGEPGDLRLTSLVRDLGGVAVLAALREQAVQETSELSDDLAARLREVDPAAELERAGRAGLRFVVPGDTEWPDHLDGLDHAPALHERGGLPVGLWLRGPMRLDEACSQAVAVVGSRSATTYGAEVAGEIAATVAGAGCSVVSGAAFGIDQAAHRGALAVRGPTIAVLASGADRPYPSAHRQLIDYIAEVGLVISEAPPGAAPTRIRFLARNRLIAALTAGTVVVEAAARSGALNTANWAAGLGRTVMGVPGPVTSAPSVGVHQLIRNKSALLVTKGTEVLEVVGPAGAHLLVEERGPETVRDRLSVAERQVLDAVPVLHGAAARSVARTAGLTVARTQEALGHLLDLGLLEHGSGRWRLRRPGPEAP